MRVRCPSDANKAEAKRQSLSNGQGYNPHEQKATESGALGTKIMRGSLRRLSRGSCQHTCGYPTFPNHTHQTLCPSNSPLLPPANLTFPHQPSISATITPQVNIRTTINGRVRTKVGGISTGHGYICHPTLPFVPGHPAAAQRSSPESPPIQAVHGATHCSALRCMVHAQ